MRSLPRTALSVPIVVFLALALAGQSMAATWGSKVVVEPTGFVDVGGVVTFANGTAVAVIEKCVDAGSGLCFNAVRVRRSTDSGQTWGPKIYIAGADGEADMPAIAGRGKYVDVVWRGDGLLYRRSTDQGQTFGPARYISHQNSVSQPEVARGPNGLVAVAWGEWPQFTAQTSVRVSTDGGRTFGKKHSWPADDPDWSSVAVGDGVVYVAYGNRANTSVVRRSLDGGETWSAAMRLEPLRVSADTSLTAEGKNAYVAWGTPEGGFYQRTDNRGATWSEPEVYAVTAPIWDTYISLQGGVARALYGVEDGLYYRESSDGVTWSSPHKVSSWSWGYVGRSGDRVVVIWSDDYNKIFARTRPV